MKFVFSHKSGLHAPRHYLNRGNASGNPDRPKRTDLLREAALAAGLEEVPARAFDIRHVAAVHDQRYLAFLEGAARRWAHVEPGGEVIPSVHPQGRAGGYPKSVEGQAGFHMMDSACPIGEGTWEAAIASADTALTAATLLEQGERLVYALCRPPGHHAAASVAGGFCYLNNAAVAAAHLAAGCRRVAILDLDLHHGNGTQDIFYRRSDVLTLSIHAHPERFYPFFWGYTEETGEGEGEGCNFNLPLPRGSGDEIFLSTLALALARVRDFAPDVLIVPMGWDTHERDPMAGFRLTTACYGRAGRAVAALALPTLVVQEGGYAVADLKANLLQFLEGLRDRA